MLSKEINESPLIRRVFKDSSIPPPTLLRWVMGCGLWLWTGAINLTRNPLIV
jgi:hypothetical protein